MGKLCKILIWGKTAVGKTSLIEQLAYGRIEERVSQSSIEIIHCDLVFMSHI